MATKVTAKAVDFSNVKDAGNFNTKRIPAGDYLAKIIKVEDGESKKDNAFQYVFTIKVMKHASASYPYYCKLQENQLWKLRNLLVAAGQNIPKKRFKVDPSKVVGKMIGVTIEDAEYNDKEKSEIGSVFPASELGDDVVQDHDEDEADEGDEEYEDEPEAEEEEADEEEADDEAEDEADEFEGMDRAALKKYINAADAKFAFKKSQTDDDLRAKARELAGNSGDEDEELEELDIDDL
jgi:hypothetical protein